MDCNTPVLHCLPEFAQTHVRWVIDAILPFHPLLPLLLPSIFSSIRVFSNELALCIRWPKCWSFSFSLSPSNEYSGLISFRIDWFDFLAVQGTLESFLQHHNSKALVLWCSAFFMVQLSDSYTLGSISFWKVLSLWTLLQSRNRLLSWYKIALIFQSLTSCSEFPEQCWFTFYTPLLALVFWPFISPAHIKFLFPNMWWPLLHPHETSLNSHS